MFSMILMISLEARGRAPLLLLRLRPAGGRPAWQRGRGLRRGHAAGSGSSRGGTLAYAGAATRQPRCCSRTGAGYEVQHDQQQQAVVQRCTITSNSGRSSSTCTCGGSSDSSSIRRHGRGAAKRCVWPVYNMLGLGHCRQDGDRKRQHSCHLRLRPGNPAVGLLRRLRRGPRGPPIGGRETKVGVCRRGGAGDAPMRGRLPTGARVVTCRRTSGAPRLRRGSPLDVLCEGIRPQALTLTNLSCDTHIISIPLPKQVLQTSHCNHVLYGNVIQTVFGMGTSMNVTAHSQ